MKYRQLKAFINMKSAKHILPG